MPRYRVNTRSFINDMLIEEGGEVEYNGIPGSNLDPIDAAAKRAKAKAEGKADSDDEGEFTVIDPGKDLESPFTPANPPPGDGESRKGSHDGEHPNPMADRPGDPQAEVGPTRDQVDPKGVAKSKAEHEKAKANGPKDGSDLA